MNNAEMLLVIKDSGQGTHCATIESSPYREGLLLR